MFTSFSVGYHGYHGIHTLVADPDANAYGFGSLPKALCTSSPVPPCADPRFGGITKLYSAAVSNYHGVVVSLKHRFRSQGQLQANYTFSHAVPARAPGNAAFCGEGAALPLAPRPCFPPQVLSSEMPNPDAPFVQSTCETGFNTGNLPGPMGACKGSPVSFVQRRNSFRAPKFVWTDFAITKNTKVPAGKMPRWGSGFQFFNLFNHTNFGGSDNFASNPTFGKIFYLTQPPTGLLGGGASQRMIQVKAQLRF